MTFVEERRTIAGHSPESAQRIGQAHQDRRGSEKQHEDAAWQESALTDTEQRLLRGLLQHPDEAQPVEAIFQWVWPGEDVDDLGLRPDQRDRLRRLVFNVRQKIELDPRSPRLLRTVYGLGYALYTDQKDAAP